MYQKIEEAEVEDDQIKVRVRRMGAGGFNLALSSDDIERAKKEYRYPRPIKTHSQMERFSKFIRGRVINIHSLGDNRDREKVIKEVRKMSSKKTVKVEVLFYGYDRNKTKSKDVIDKFTGAKDKIQAIKGLGKLFKGFSKIKTEKPGEEKDDELSVILSFDKQMHEKGHLEPLLTEVISVLLDLTELGNLEFGNYEVKE